MEVMGFTLCFGHCIAGQTGQRLSAAQPAEQVSMNEVLKHEFNLNSVNSKFYIFDCMVLDQAEIR
jgi:hypothetical protein